MSSPVQSQWHSLLSAHRMHGILRNPAEATADRDQTDWSSQIWKFKKKCPMKFASLWGFSFCTISFQAGYKSLHCITLNFFNLLKAWVWLRLVYSWYNSFEWWDMYKLKGLISKSHCFSEERNYLRQHTDTRILNARAAHPFSYILCNTSADQTWKLYEKFLCLNRAVCAAWDRKNTRIQSWMLELLS